MMRFALAFASVFSSLALHAEEMKPGLWEITSQMKMQGFQMPANKFTHCYTAKDIEAGKHYRPESGSDCKISNLKQSGKQISFDLTCKSGSETMTMSTQGTVSATSFQFEQKMRSAQMGEATVISQGRRISDCK
ncbi:MAG: DUF3617 domain-containing protein [Rhodocyclaceae bacterium]|nr:DUF3617 domain-containing protein [Rhodocyclaceae bacterium]